MKFINCRSIALFLVLCFLISVPPMVSASTQGDAASAIQSAQTQLANSYQSAVQAEHAGGNITDLAGTLNDAGSLLSQAEYAYSTGNFGSAQSLAIQSQAKLNDFTAQANILKQNANSQRIEDFWIGFVAPILGSLAVIIVGFAVWTYLKRRYGTSGVNVNGPSKL